MERFEDADGSWYLKTYRYEGARAALRGAFRNTFGARSRVRRELDALQRLEREGVQAELDAEILEKRRFGFLILGQMLTRDFGGIDLAERLRRAPGSAGWSLETWRALGTFVQALQDAGLRDPDLKARNILTRAEGESWAFAKIDASSSRLVAVGRRGDRAGARDRGILVEDLRSCGASDAAIDAVVEAWGGSIVPGRKHCAWHLSTGHRGSD